MLITSRGIPRVLPSYVITGRRRKLGVRIGDKTLCVEAGPEGPLIVAGCEPDYLVVEPYRGVRAASAHLEPASFGAAKFLEFYLVSGFGVHKFKLVVEQSGRAKLRRSYEVELFNGFIKSGQYKELERAFENFVRAYAGSCILGCAASLGLAIDPSNLFDLSAGMRKIDGLYHEPGIALYVEERSRSSAVLEVVASTAVVYKFRRILMRAFEESEGLHWAYMGRLVRSRPSIYIDVFLPRPRRNAA